MRNKYLFSVFAATAVIVAPVAVEQTEAASTANINFGNYIDQGPEDEWEFISITDVNGKELEEVRNKVFKVSNSDLNKFYEYEIGSYDGYDGDYFYLTGTLSNPIIQHAYYSTEWLLEEALRSDSSIKIVKHSFKKSTPRIFDGHLYIAFEKAGDTIELSNGMTVKITGKNYIGSLEVTKTKTTKQVTIHLNGKQLNVQAGQSPYVANGTTMVPLRVISEALGATVNYNPNKSITLSVGSKQITLNNNSKVANIKGGSTITMSAPVTIKNGTTYVPLRFISESFGAMVNWDQAKYQVTITK